MEAMIGVIGTILGTVLGWFLNSISNRGRINLYVSSWENKFLGKNQLGEIVEVHSVEDMVCYSCSFALDIYNSSGEPKIMRDIHVAYNNGKNDVIKCIPGDEDTRRLSAGATRYDNITPLTIPPKSVLQVHLRDGLWHTSSEFQSLWDVEKIYLVYTDERNKEKRVLLTSKSIKQSLNEKNNTSQKGAAEK